MSDGPAGLGVERVVVWRHGRTSWNATGRFQGQADPPLDEVGQAQARQAAPYLAAAAPELILTSDLDRAASTARAFTDLMPVPLVVDRRLREVDLGSWQGLTRDEVQRTYPEQFEQWLQGNPPAGRGGETRQELDVRVLAALSDIKVRHVLLVTHGGTSRSIIETLLGVPAHAGRWLAVLGNCHWSQLQRSPSGWQLRSHNVWPVSEAILGTFQAGPNEGGDADAVEADTPAG